MEAMNVVKNFVLHAYGAPGKVTLLYTHHGRSLWHVMLAIGVRIRTSMTDDR